jgi:hypothetical protein
MPFIKFTTSISLNGEIISPYSRCLKKGLVYIILIISSSRQPSFYLEYTKANTQLSYNIYSIPLNEYICLTIHFNTL